MGCGDVAPMQPARGFRRDEVHHGAPLRVFRVGLLGSLPDSNVVKEAEEGTIENWSG